MARLALALAALLVLGGCHDAGDEATGAGGVIAFTVFEDIPPRGACPGIWTVDPESGGLAWLGGFDRERDEFALYPQFTARGELAYAYFAKESTQRLPLVDVVTGGDRIATVIFYAGWEWSPTRDELLFARSVDRGTRLELRVRGLRGGERVIARRAGVSAHWLPDGDTVVYERVDGDYFTIWTVSRAGHGARQILGGAWGPLPSPDGRRVAFLRRGPNPDTFNVTLHVAGIDGRRQRKLAGWARNTELKPVAWMSAHELVVQRGEEEDPLFDSGSEVHVLDVDTGEARVIARRAFVLDVAPDRTRLLFVRRHMIGGEHVYSVRTMRIDGSDERMLAVVDEEDLNIGSNPVWQPRAVPLHPFGDEFDADPEECARRLERIIDRVRG